MVDGGSSDLGLSLVGYFLEFAEKLLALARSLVDVEGMPKRVEHPFLFRAPEFSGPAALGSTITFSGVEKPDFRGLLLFNLERWANPEAERCAQEHFSHDLRRDRQVLDENWQLIASPTFGDSGNQLGSRLTYEVYYAIADLCERLQTLLPTVEQLLEAYERLTEEWTRPTVMWHLGAPLLNFKTEKCPVRIGQSLELAALSHEDKTRLWNQNAAFGPFGDRQVMDLGDLARAQFVLRGSSTLLKTMYEVRNEISHEGKLLSDEGVRGKVAGLGPVIAKDYLHACEDVARDVLRECVLRLAAGGSLKALSEELDNNRKLL